jgi:adenylate cyclase
MRSAGFGREQVGAAFARARELCQQLGKTSQLCRVLGELSIFYYVRAEHQRARGLGEEALNLAQRAKDPQQVAVGHWHLGFILFSLGEYSPARAHLKHMISFYEPHQHHHPLVVLRGLDAGLSALAYDACCLWCLGYPDEALRKSQEALTLARELDHPFSLADVLTYGGCLFNRMGRDAGALKDNAEELVRLSVEKGLAGWLPIGTCFRGEALVMLGQVQEGIAQMREGITASLSIGERCHMSGSLLSLAEAYAKAGQTEKATATLDDAQSLVEKTEERHWESELHRLRAELLLMRGDEVEAEASFHKAIAVARRQNAKSWELRATTSLARLWQKQGKLEEARRVVEEIYGWFAVGFDTPDLEDAKALLDELT